jgi:hypothetical protein
VLANRTPGPAGATNTPQPATTQTTAATTSQSQSPTGFPAPPDGAVVFSRRHGHNVLALGVVPGRRLLLQASVVGVQGNGVNGLPISFRVGSKLAPAQPCGAGCYRAPVAPPDAPRSVEVDVGKTAWKVTMPRQWPPKDASAIVARATHTFRSLRTVAVRDWLTSGPQRPLFTRWTIVAPNKLSYQVENGPAAVIIGSRRWDKLPGQKWEQSAQTPIHQPTPFWVSWTDAHVLDSTKSAWHVSFFDPKTPGWYELYIAKPTMLTTDVRMNATAHFMREVYSRFNGALRVMPP